MTIIHAQSFSFDLPVWRMVGNILADAQAPALLLIELRNRDQVAWASLNLSTQQLIWQHAIGPADWWTGSVGCYNGVLLLHRYANAEQPAPKGLLAVNATSGEVIWELEQAVFVQTDGRLLQTARRNAAQEPICEWRQLANAQPVVELPPIGLSQRSTLLGLRLFLTRLPTNITVF